MFAVRRFVAASCLLLCCVAGCRERLTDEPSVAAVPADPWVVAGAEDDPAAQSFASCASCHMADGSGRPDGSIPRLAGQRAAILVHKLDKIRRGESWVPPMVPFARALTDEEIAQVAGYLERLPVPVSKVTSTEGAAPYRAYCAACHGASAEGNDALRAPRLCGQHAPYLERRMDESLRDARGDADPAMRAILSQVAPEQRQRIAAWLAGGACAAEAGS